MGSNLDMRAVLIAAVIGIVGGFVLNFILAFPSAFIPFCGCLYIIIYPITGALYPVFARSMSSSQGAGSSAVGGALAAIANALFSILCAVLVVGLIFGLAGGIAVLDQAGLDSDMIEGFLAAGFISILTLVGVSVALLLVSAGLGAAGGAIYTAMTGSSSSSSDYGRLG